MPTSLIRDLELIIDNEEEYEFLDNLFKQRKDINIFSDHLEIPKDTKGKIIKINKVDMYVYITLEIPLGRFYPEFKKSTITIDGKTFK